MGSAHKAEAVGQAREVCPSHEYIDRTLSDLKKAVEKGFQDLGKQLGEMRVAAERRETDLVMGIASSIERHRRECTLNDITQVGIKLPTVERRGHSDSPISGVRRRSLLPLRMPNRIALGVGIGVAIVVLAIGIWVGVVLATGSAQQATGTVKDVAATAAKAN